MKKRIKITKFGETFASFTHRLCIFASLFADLCFSDAYLYDTSKKNMPKKYWFLFIAFGLLLVVNGWLNLYSQNKRVQLSQLTLDSTIYPKIDVVHTSMKPAWYQFFMPRGVVPPVSKSNLPIAFVAQENPQNPTLMQWYLVNQTQLAYQLPTENGSLLMIQEAQNKEGKWKPVEYWASQWGSGASMPAVHQTLTLEPQKAVMIVAPKYEGVLKTNLRFKFKAVDAKGKKIMLYSPVFRGSVAPTQFEVSVAEKKKGVSYLD